MSGSPSVYSEMTAAFAVTPEIAPLFELAIGFHPDKQRHMTEEEEYYPLSILRWVDREQLVGKATLTEFEKLALMWLRWFPEIEDIVHLPARNFYACIWEELMKKIDPVIIAYAFYALDLAEQPESKQVRLRQRGMQRHIEQLAVEKEKRRIIWTLPFPALSPLGEPVERKSGLSAQIKRRLAIGRYPFGLLCNYLLSRDESVEDVLSAHQFEDLVGLAFEDDGWEVFRMKKTRDGGKDAIVRRSDGDTTTIAYVQAKRYGPSNKVRLAQVKEFAATVHWDNADKGYLVTTSSLTGPAADWLNSRRLSPAIVEMIDRHGLMRWLKKIADRKTAVYLLEDL